MKASLLNKNIFKNSYPALFQVVEVYIVKFYIVGNSHWSTLDFSRLRAWKFHKILRVSCENNAGNVFYACVCVFIQDGGRCRCGWWSLCHTLLTVATAFCWSHPQTASSGPANSPTPSREKRYHQFTQKQSEPVQVLSHPQQYILGVE